MEQENKEKKKGNYGNGGRRLKRKKVQLPVKEKKFLDLPEKQKAFAQFVVQGMTYQNAYLSAGYLKNRDHNDEKVKRLAQQSGSLLMQNPLIKRYVYQNKALAFEPEDGCSIESIKSRLRQIMDGELFVPSYDKKGNRIQLAPMHRDMISSAELLFKIVKWESERPKSSIGEFEIEDDLLDESTSFLEEMAKGVKPKADSTVAVVSSVQGVTQETLDEIVKDKEEDNDDDYQEYEEDEENEETVETEEETE